MTSPRLPALVDRTRALPAFPSLEAEQWREVEETIAWVLDHFEALVDGPSLLEAGFAYAAALYDHGDECGAEEVWERLLPSCAAAGEAEMAAITTLRLARCTVDHKEDRAALAWCRRARALARGAAKDHPVHAAIDFQLGLIHLYGRDFLAARTYFLRALERPAAGTGTLLRWQGLSPSDLRIYCYNSLADVAFQETAAGHRSRSLCLEEARGWLARCGPPVCSTAAGLFTQVNWAELADLSGRHDVARTMLEGLLVDARLPEPLRTRWRPILLRLLAIVALSEDDLPRAQSLARDSFRAAAAGRSRAWEHLMVRDLVRIFSRDHERRHSGYREEQVLQTLEGEGSWILSLVEYVEERDQYAGGGHARAVAAVAEALLSCLDRPPEAFQDLTEMDRNYLRGAALLHDIGKLEVSWALLNRLRPLEPRHQRRLHDHVLTGARMLERLGFPMTARIVEEHHERADGGGYPFGTRDQTPAGALLALSERIAARCARTRTVTRPPSLESTVQWCLQDARAAFQPLALGALYRAAESGALAPLQAHFPPNG